MISIVTVRIWDTIYKVNSGLKLLARLGSNRSVRSTRETSHFNLTIRVMCVETYTVEDGTPSKL